MPRVFDGNPGTAHKARWSSSIIRWKTGKNRGEQFRIAISMQETGYPEYPPHWIHISPPVNDGLGGSTSQYKDNDGREWMALSRPPG